LTRFLVLLAAASAAWGQFGGLATPSDGSAVYFTTSLRLKGTLEPPWGKVFVADERGVRAVVSRHLRTLPLPPGYIGNCVLGELYRFGAVELSADGRSMAAGGARWSAGQCRVFASATLLRTPSGSRDISGALRMSANARWAIVDTTVGFNGENSAVFLDLQSGAQTAIAVAGGQSLLNPLSFAPGRTIADDGTALLFQGGKPYLVRPGQPLQPFPVAGAQPWAISTTGARVLYSSADGVHIVDLQTGDDQALGAGRPTGFSDDGSRATLVRAGQLYVGGLQVGSVPDGISSAILSGNGKIAYAVTANGRMVKIAVDTGITTELVGRTPDISFTGALRDAGMFTTITGLGFSDQSYSASAPLPLTLGGVSVSLDGRLLPISRVTPTEIDALIPWDMASSAPRTVVVNVSAARSPFEAPQGTLQVAGDARAGALYRQDWSSTVSDLTVHTGEIIHVFAVGLGAVTPEVPTGSAAPSSEPLARLASPMTCSNATVLYAGLQPGTVARIYQVDLQIGTKTGYQVFSCGPLGLTLNVVQ
jgi:uncharacterized protein (TIGR03437 family)